MIPRARSFRSINRRIISTNSTVFLPSRTSARREGRKREGKRDERWETIPSISGTLIHDDWARANRSNPSVSPKTLFIYLSDPNPFPSLFYFSPLPVSRFLLSSFPGNLYRGQDRGISGPKRAPISLIAVLPEENRVSPKSDESISISWRSPTDRRDDSSSKRKDYHVNRDKWRVAKIDRWFRISPRICRDGSWNGLGFRIESISGNGKLKLGKLLGINSGMIMMEGWGRNDRLTCSSDVNKLTL